MRLTTQVFFKTSLLAFGAGLLGGIISTALSPSPSLRWAVVNMPQLVRQQVQMLRHLSGDDEALERAAHQQAARVKRAIARWAQQHQVVVLSREHVLSPLPDVTNDISRFLEAR